MPLPHHPADPDADPDAGPETPEPRPARQQRLSRERIVETAVRFIDEHGTAGLTMRGLGSILGVEAMALYRYVSGKDELLEAVADDLVASAVVIERAPGDAWQDVVRRLARRVRAVALSHPRAFPLVLGRTTVRGLRPPLSTPAAADAFLHELVEGGFDDRAAAAAYRQLTAFLLGHLLLETSAATAASDGLDDPVADQSEPTALDAHPTLRRVQPGLADDGRSEAEFDEALDALMEQWGRARRTPTGR